MLLLMIKTCYIIVNTLHIILYNMPDAILRLILLSVLYISFKILTSLTQLLYL